MICVTISQTDQRLAKVDMHNASKSCDLIELQLDRFKRAPEMKALLENRPKPIIVSCRRPKDGGNWEGTEQARLAMLRQAVLDGADYVEIEEDVAGQIPRYGKTKRVITYANTSGVPEDLDKIYRSCCQKDPDVVKLTMPTRTPEEAWPLIKVLAKGKTPTVAVGWGVAGIMLNILGRRYKAPWTYAALEKGMEAYPGMATIDDLEKIFDYKNIDSKTPLMGVCGVGREQPLTIKVLNHGFRLAGKRTRCLPIQIGQMDMFRKIVGAIKLTGVLVADHRRKDILEVLSDKEEAVERSGAADFIDIDGEKWRGFNIHYRTVVRVIEENLSKHYDREESLAGRTLMVVGCSGTARSIATAIVERKGIVTIADPDVDRARELASELGARYVAPTQVYTTICDGMILCRSDSDPQPGKAAIDIPKTCARAGMFAVDLTDFPLMTTFLDEIRVQEGIVIKPIDIFVRMMKAILKASTGRSFTTEEIRQPIADEPIELPEIEESFR